MQAFEKKGKLQLPVKHVLLRFLTAPFVFLVGRLFQNIVRLKSLSAFHFSFLHVLKRFARLKIYALLLLFGGVLTFNAKGQTNVNVGSGASSTATTTFVTNNTALAPRGYRIQVVYTPAELTAAGWVAGNGYVISQIGIKYKTNAAPQALNNYTIRMGHTALDFNTDVPVAGLTTVKNAFTYTTPTAPADPTYDMITLDANFTWNGTSSICIDVCYTTSATTTRPTMYAFTGGIRSVNSTASQCAVATNSASSGTVKPQVRLVFSSGAACSAPNTQALNIVTTPAGTSASINWTNGNGGGRVVYVNTTNSFTAPTNGTNPTANLTYTSGQQCVFNGTGSGAITVTGLTASTQYFVRVYEYCTPTRNYITTTGTNNPNSFTTTAACTAPNGTVAFGAFSGVSSTATTTNVNYTNGGNVATGYVLLRNSTNTAPTAPASGTAVPSAGSTSFVSGYTVVGTSTTLGSSQAFNSTGLTASTTYYYWVVAYQNTNGPCWFTPTTQASNSQTTSAPPATYCTASLYTSGCGSGDNIGNVSTTLGSTNITNNGSGCSAGSYSLHSATSLTTTVGGSFTLNVQTGGSFGQGFGVWIDYDQDGTFAATEFVYASPVNTTLNSTTIIVPGTALTGATRMRVRCNYNTAITSGQACTVFTFGETEDYTVNIGAPCTAPTSQATIGTYTNNVSPGTSLTVNWSRGTPSPGNGVVVVARLTATSNVDPTSGTTYTANTAFGSGSGSAITGAGNFVIYVGTGTTANITGLTAGTSYTFTVYEYNTTSTCYKTPGSSSAVTTAAPPSGFSDCYIPANWSLSGGNGSVNTTSAPTSIAFTGPTTGGATTLYQITVPTTGTIGFNWSTTHGDPTYVTFGYKVNSTSTPITSTAASGTISSVSVNAGDVFAFYGTANFGAFATFVATISNFTRTCPASCTAPNGTVSFQGFSSVASSTTTTNVTYANGANTATGYVVLRNIANTAPTAPASGTAVPTAGSTSFVSGYTVVGSSTTLGSSQAFNSTGLSGSTTYYYWVVAYQNTGGPCWFTPATQSSNSQATTAAACTAPNGTVSFGAFSGVTSSATTTIVTYPNGGNTATGYALLRNSSNAAPTAPASGTAVPTAGSTSFVSGYTVVNTTTTIGSSVAFNSTGLSASTTYYYWVVAYQSTNGPCWFTPVTQANNSQATSVACVAPATPATPTGSQTGVCSGSQYTYSVTAVAGATSYDWTLPPGWTAASTNTATNSITATAGSSGFLSVRANNCGGSSAYSSNLGISVTTSPTISFPEGQTVYTGCRILITANPSSPSFSLSGGIGTSSSGGNTYLLGTSVTASSIQASNGGCLSPVYTITVTAGITNRGTLASGDQAICDGQTPNSIAYSSAATGTGITYQWYYKNTDATCPTTNEATTGWTIISGAQSNSYSPAQGFVPAGSTYTFACYVGSSLGSCGGWSSGCRKITVNSIPSAPTGSASQSFCFAASPTVAALSATGTAIQWYDAATNGSLLASSAALTNGTSYYASQTVSGCESTNRLAVAVTVTTTPSAPTGSASQSFCSAANPTVASLSATGTTILWYAASSGGSSLATSTALTNSTSYYASQTVSGCESTNRLAVAAVLNANGTWIGGTSSDWGNTANWCGGVPASGANILFSPSAVNNLVLDQNRTVGNVDFNGTSRSIHLGAYDLTTSGIISNYSASSYVKSAGTGKLIATLVDGATFIFPIGNTSYNPLSIKNTTGASDAFSVGLKDAVYLNGSSGTTISTPHVSRTWDISKTNANAGTGVDLIFNWNTGDLSGTLVDPRMNHHTGNGWEIPTTITSSTAGTNTLTVVGYTGTFSPFAIGEGSSPLPVELVSFQANCIDQGVALTWQTASEHSSAYFEVDRSEDSQNWSLLEQVAAAGNSTSLLSYSILDSEKVRNTVYYRLNQVDFDGANKRYNPIYMNCGNIGNVITTYPNPSTDNGFQLLFENSLGERIIGLNILDALGNLVYTKELQLQHGINSFGMYDFKVETGVYFLQIKEADGVTSLIKHVHFSK